MKQISYFTLIAGTVASLIISGCSKKTTTPDNPAAASASAPSITISDGFGALAAVRSVSYTTVAGLTIPLEINTAVAVFPTASGATTFNDGGTVTLNTKALTKSTNNTYSYQNLTNPLSFTQITWNVTGSSSVPAISYTDNKPIPDFSGFSTLPTAITRASGVTISLGNAITNADSVYVVVADFNSHSILKRLAGNAGQCDFSSAELSGFTAGQGMVQVCPWNLTSEDFSSKKFYFIIETAYTKQGITIN